MAHLKATIAKLEAEKLEKLQILEAVIAAREKGELVEVPREPFEAGGRKMREEHRTTTAR